MRWGLGFAVMASFFIGILPFHAGAEPLKTLSLENCYRMALKQSEEVAVRAELITETEGRFQQALSGLLPKITFSSIDKKQDGDGGSAFTRRNVPERKFTFSQPLFSGFKEFAAMRGSKSEKRLREQEKARAEQLLLVDVSDSFHLLLQQRREIGVLDAIRQTLRERIRELEDREKIGRSRASERVAVQAQLYRVEAEWEQAQTREQVSFQLLQFLTGLDVIAELADPGPELPALGPEEAYRAKGPSRPDVKGAEQSLEISRQELKVARSKFFPTAGLEGNYYVERSGAAQDVKWDASLNVDVPLFQGGGAVGANKEAESVVRQADLKLQQTRRVADQEIRDAYTEYGGALARLRALTKALEATEESYQMQVQEYRLNLVSNLEVLSTLQILQDARRDLTSALYDAHRLYWKLQATAGESIG
ncbi:MAG: TolC family protein [Candidatus Omnitrophota bacterium]|nr:TolC family protein [Candidatus Omnitrophota bacterium]